MEEPLPEIDASIRDLFFGYDRALPFNAVERDLGVSKGVRVLHFVIDSTHGQRVPGLLWVADGAPPGLPLILLQHGAGSRKEDPYISLTAQRWARDGFAVAAIDAAGHGERETRPRDPALIWALPWQRCDHAVQMCVDLHRTLDYLAGRPEVDATRTGYVGFSMGTINGVAFVARDARVQASVFCIGGARLHELRVSTRDLSLAREHALVAQIIDPVHFAPSIAPRPVLMINGRRDDVVPPAAAEALFAALNEPKQLVWYDGGHTDLRGQHFKLMEAFLREHL